MSALNGRPLTQSDSILIGIIKFQLFLMIVYEGWYLEKFPAISGLLQLLAATIVGTTALLFLTDPKCGRNKTFLFWAVFGIYSMIAALAVNASLSIVTSSLFTYFAFIAVVFCAGIVSGYTGDYTWFSKAVLFVCLISAYCALFQGVPYQNGPYFVTTMGEENNPNNLGLMMSIGTFVAVFPEKKPRFFGWLLRIGILVAFLAVTINTGSRSSLLCELAAILFFLYTQMKNATGNGTERFVKRIAILSVAVVGIIIAINLVVSNNADGSAINRLMEKFNSDEFSGRTDLYVLAWDMFKESPVFGIGYNCFAAFNYGYFTHSTYMELLACTGTIGFLLFLLPVFFALKKSLKAFRLDGGRSITILAIMLISGFFGIIYYGMIFLMVLYMEISRIPETNKQPKRSFQ